MTDTTHLDRPAGSTGDEAWARLSRATGVAGLITFVLVFTPIIALSTQGEPPFTMEHALSRLVAETAGDEPVLSRPTGCEYQYALTRLMILELQPAWPTHLRSRSRLRDKARTRGSRGS